MKQKKLHKKESKIERSFERKNSDNFCYECLYDWCSNKEKVTFCTMKSKGLFECQTCLMKLSTFYERTSALKTDELPLIKELISTAN